MRMKVVSLVLLLSACAPERPAAVDPDSVFTGGNWGGSGHWQTCKETTRINEYVCTEQIFDGSINRAGIYFHLPESSAAKDPDGENNLPSGFAIYHKSGNPYYMLGLVQPSGTNNVTYMVLRPRECYDAILRNDPSEAKLLSAQKYSDLSQVSLETYTSMQREINSGALSQLGLTLQAYEDFRISTDPFDSCEIRFQYP
ncbi:hypothetical protein [Parvularcula sp. IMCC14364]|uniref:hypothetical protein n=1 Tax=Parvularcula sp. IMCC14364 TaxID=3067902 RepID=UPI002742234F|nr:hypothetical protein [Parvularcula sp. IMCC14364]